MFRNLDNIRPGLKALVSALYEDYPYASVLAVEDSWRRWSVSRQGVNIDASGFGGGSGYVVRVFDGVGCAEYSFNRFSMESIPEIKALIAGRLAAQNKALGDIDPLPTPIPSDEPAVLSKQCAYKLDPRELGDEAIIDRLSGIRTKALGLDERIMEAQVSMAHRAYRKVFISENRDLDQTYMWTTCSMAMMVSRGQELKYAFKSSSNLGGAEVLDQVEDGLDGVARSAIDLLDSEPIPPGEYDCVCDPDTTGMIVHEAFGHGVEMDMFVKDRALGREYIDKYVASGLVTMHDGSTVLEAATMAFDDEGTLTGDTVVIDRGILKTGMCDALSQAHRQRAPGELRAQGLHPHDQHLLRGREQHHGGDDFLHRLRLPFTAAQLRHGGPKKLGHSVYGDYRPGDKGRQAHRQNLLPYRTHRLRARPFKVCQHDGRRS